MLPKRQTIAGAVTVASACLALAACAGSPSSSAASGGSAGSLTVVKFVGPADPNGLIDNIAYGAQEGIFRKYGIDLQITYPASGGTSSDVPLVASNQYQLSQLSVTAMMADYEKGLKTECIASSVEGNLTGVSLRKDLGITTPQQLAGHTVGVPIGTPSVQLFQVFLKKYGIQSSVHVVQLSLSALTTAFLAKRIDGVVAYPALEDPEFNGMGTPTNDLFFTDYGLGNAVTSCFGVADAWADAHPKTVTNLVKAIQESTVGAEQHAETASHDLVATAPHTADPYPYVVKEWQATEKGLTTASTADHMLGWMSPDDFSKTLTFAEQFMTVTPMDPTAIYTNKFVNESNGPVWSSVSAS